MKINIPMLIAALALALSVGALVASLNSVPAEVGPDDATLNRIELLEREIAHLKGGVYSEQASSSTNGALTVRKAAPEIAASPEFHDKGSEGVVEEVEDMRWIMTVRGLMPPTEEHLRRSRDTILDSRVSAKEKLVALRILRGADQRSDEVVRAMIDTFYQTTDHGLQAEIFRHLDDVDTPELVQPLLEASASSPSSRVRREAIDALSGFLPDPDLNEWLNQVVANDTDKRVRQEAQRLIDKHSDNATNQ